MKDANYVTDLWLVLFCTYFWLWDLVTGFELCEKEYEVDIVDDQLGFVVLAASLVTLHGTEKFNRLFKFFDFREIRCDVRDVSEDMEPVDELKQFDE